MRHLFSMGIFAIVLLVFLMSISQGWNQQPNASSRISSPIERKIRSSVPLQIVKEEIVNHIKKITHKKRSEKKASNMRQASVHPTRRVNSTGINLVTEYRVPVEEYLKAMERVGAQVVVYDQTQQKVVCRMLDGRIQEWTGAGGFSSRGHLITTEYPESERLLTRVRGVFGNGTYDIILLIPEILDRKIFDSVYGAIEGEGLARKDTSSVLLEVTEASSRIRFCIRRAHGIFGVREMHTEVTLQGGLL